MLQGVYLLLGEPVQLLFLENEGTTKVEFEDGEVPMGAARESRKPFHTAPVNCGFLYKALVSNTVKDQNCNKGHVFLRLVSPSMKKSGFPVCASAFL